MQNTAKIIKTDSSLFFRKRALKIRSEEAAAHMHLAKLNYAEVEGVYRQYNVNPLDVRQLERLLMLLINKCRTESRYYEETKGLAQKLVWHERAVQIARTNSWDMALRGFFSHQNPQGETVAERVSKINIAWSVVGENIAVGDDVVAAHFGFMNEPPFQQNHRSNILNIRFTHCGIGVVRASDGTFFVSEIFLREK